jgi:tetratricopeptide (TPR) repeat protein
VRKRTFFAIVLTVFALPALASDPPGRIGPFEPSNQPKPPSADTLVAIADVRLDAAFDAQTSVGDRAELLGHARDGYQLALRTDPKHAGAILGLARYYARTEQRDSAVEMFKKYLTLYPEAEVAREVALVHAHWKDWPGAVKWCEYALKIDPENREAKKTLGFCLARAGKWDEAFATLCRVMPEAQARLNLAGVLDHVGRADDAKVQLRLALKADETYTPARDLLRELEADRTAEAARRQPAAISQYKLKRASAEAVAVDVANCAEKKGWTNVRVTFDVANNAVFFSADPEVARLIREMIAALDKEPIVVAAGEEKPLPSGTASAGDSKPRGLPQDVASGTERRTATYKLRNIAAADAAQQINNAFVKTLTILSGGLDPVNQLKILQKTVVVVAEPVSNTLLVSTTAEYEQEIARLIAQLDKAPPQFLLQAMVVQVKREFIETAGFNVGGQGNETTWTLSPREMHMLTALFRGAKEKGELDVFSRPLLQICDNQTGTVFIGQERPFVSGFEIVTTGGVAAVAPKKETIATGITFQATPRLAPDGKSILLNVDYKCVEEAAAVKTPLVIATGDEVIRTAHFVTVPTFAKQAASARAELKPGHTLVFAAGKAARPSLTGLIGRAGSDAGEKFETLIIVTPVLVKQSEPVCPKIDQQGGAKADRNENVRTVYVPVFNNRAFQTTSYRGFEADVTQAVIREIAKTTNLRVTADYEKADTELVGEIAAVTKTMLNVNQKNYLRMGEVTVTLDCTWRDLRTGEILSAPRRASNNPKGLPGTTEPARIVATDHYIPDLGETSATAVQRMQNQIAVRITELLERGGK